MNILGCHVIRNCYPTFCGINVSFWDLIWVCEYLKYFRCSSYNYSNYTTNISEQFLDIFQFRCAHQIRYKKNTLTMVSKVHTNSKQFVVSYSKLYFCMNASKFWNLNMTHENLFLSENDSWNFTFKQNCTQLPAR